MRTAPPQLHARIAGAAYVGVIAIGIVNGFLVDSPLLVAGDDATTTQKLLEHSGLFRLGAAATLVLYALVIALAWALYEVLKPVKAHLARLALLFRLAEGIVGISTILATLFVADLLGNPDRVAAFPPHHLHALVGGALEARTTAMDLVLVLIGIGGTIFCVLLFISSLIPRWLAAWGVVTYVSMLALGFLSLLWQDHPKTLEAIFYTPGAAFELTIGMWLLLKGVNEKRWHALSSSAPAHAQHREHDRFRTRSDHTAVLPPP